MIEVIFTFTFYSSFILIYLGLIFYNKSKNDILTESVSILSLVFLVSALSTRLVPNWDIKIYLSVFVFIVASILAVKYIVGKFNTKNISFSLKKMPWMTHLFIFIIAIFATQAILLFSLVVGIFNTPQKILLASFSILIITFILRKKQHSSLNWYYGFLLAIILSDIGIYIGINTWIDDENIIMSTIDLAILSVGLLQILLFIIIKDYVHRILNIVVFCISIIFIQSGSLSYFSLTALLIFLTLIMTIAKYSKKDVLLFKKEINDGVFVSIFILSFLIIFNYSFSDSISEISTIIFQILSSVLLFYVNYKQLKTNNLLSKKIVILTVVTVVVSSYIPALNSILTVLIISFNKRHKYLTIFSIILTVLCYNVLHCQDHLTKFSYSTKSRYFL